MVEEKTSGIAITALIMGILAFLLGLIPIVGWLLIILAIVFGIIGINQTKKEGVKGKGMAIAGLVLGIIPIIFGSLFMALGGLAYFGMLNPSEFVPERCLVNTGFSCDEFLLSSDGTLTAIISSNGDSGSVDLSSIEFGALTGYINSEDISFSSTDFEPGSPLVITINNLEVKSGERYTFVFEMDYTKEGVSLPKSLEGTIIVMAQ